MKRLLVLLLLVPGLARAQAPAEQPAHDLAALLPAETMVLFQGDDLGGYERWARETAMGRIWTEPEMQHFVQGLEKAVADALHRFTGGMNPLATIGLEMSDFEGIAFRNVGAALVDVSFGQGVRVDAVLAMHFRAGGDKAGKIAHAIREAIGMYTPMVFAETEVAGKKMHHLLVPNHDIHLLVADDHIVLTSQRDRMEQLVQAGMGGNPKSLAASPIYSKAIARMGAQRHAALCFANVPRIAGRVLETWARFGDEKDVAEFQHYWRALGLDAVEALAFADIPQGTGYRTELAITMSERRGLFGLVPTGTPSHRFAKFAPKGCLLYGGESMDLRQFVDQTMGLMRAIAPREAGEILAAEGEMNRFLGVNVREDIASGFGTEWAGYIGPAVGGGLIPDIAIFATVRDRAKLEKALDTVVARLTPMAAEERVIMRARSTEYRGVTIKFVEMSERRGDPIPVTPSWAFVDDFVVFALYPQTIKHALMEKESLAGSEEFRALLRAVPDSAVSSTYFDLQGVVGFLYNTAVPFLQVLQGAINTELSNYGLELNLEDLPPAHVITRHIGGAMFYTANEQDCLRMGFVSPFGAPMLLVPLAAAGAVGYMAYEHEASQRAAWARARRQMEREQEMRRALQAERQKNAAMQERMRAIEAEIAELKRLVEERAGR